VKRALVGVVLLGAGEVAAHPLSFGRLELRECDDGSLAVTWRFTAAAERTVAVRPVLPARCVASGSDVSETLEDGVARVARYRCGSPIAGEVVEVLGLEGTDAQVIARYVPVGLPTVETVLDGGSGQWLLPRGRGSSSVWLRYVTLGVEHIATGWDHLAFVLGLALMVRGRRALLAAITAFTAGHSVTLALAALGLVHAPVRAIEAAIAWSVVVVARAAAVEGTDSPGRIAPWTLAALFGLLHGFGFAGALAETGFARGAITRSLLAFNVGVELGQVAFVAVALAAARIALRAGVSETGGRRAVALGVGVAGAYWCAQRAMAFVG
jgi:hypothetical protein